MPMTLSRRRLLSIACAVPVLSFSDFAVSGGTLFINGHIDSSGTHHISGFDSDGVEYFRHALPGKAHGFAVNPQEPSHLVAFPTLPGTKAAVFDLATGQQLKIIHSKAGRHFLGHGCFSHDGALLFSNENNIDSAAGVITVRDGHTFEWIREFPAYGIGPHDIRMLPDKQTLVVAGGGLQTHPSSGKRELNINTMQSALLFIHSGTGELLAKHETPVEKLSIRHLDVGEDGTVLVACQYKGRTEMPSLVGIQRGASGIELLDVDDNTLWPLNNYTASARILDGGIGAISCPRGNCMTFWDLAKKQYITSLAINDVGGIEVSKDRKSLIASANTGELYHIDAATLNAKRLAKIWKDAKWTNHMSRVTL